MSASGPSPVSPIGPIGRAVRSVRASAATLPEQVQLLSGLVASCVVAVVLVALAPDTVPLTVLLLPLLAASLLLGPRQLPWLVGVVLVSVLAAVLSQDQLTVRVVVAALVLALAGALVLTASKRRGRLGVAAGTGEAMFVDLRDRILGQGTMPDLPPGWEAQSATRSAGGTPFAGDVVVASRRGAMGEVDRLEIVVVDVSGHGVAAGTRALLLSGAFGALLGALSAAEFLPAANDYLVRQAWQEGFASAVHLSVDLGSGDFEVRSAGHPPVVLRRGGSGRWAALDAEGPLLGLVDDAQFLCATGTLGRGDVMALYTDGMVEKPSRDIGLGIDRLLGGAERLLTGSPIGVADRLVDQVGSRDDDRTLVLVARS